MNGQPLDFLAEAGSGMSIYGLIWTVALLWMAIGGCLIGFLIYEKRRTRSFVLMRAAGQLSDVTLSSVSDGVIHTDAEGVVTFCNAAAARLCGIPVEYIVGMPFRLALRVYKGEAQTRVDNPVNFAQTAGGEATHDPYSCMGTAGGEIRPIAEKISLVRGAAGKVTGAVFVFHDIANARDLRQQLNYQARHDPLTGLPNRAALDEALTHVLQAEGSHAPAFLMYLDLDHFKLINDAQGHAAGDQLLREIATLLRKQLHPEDVLVRLGGDEFAVIARRKDAAHAQELANGLIAAVDAHRLSVGNQKFGVGLSIGVVGIDGARVGVSTLMARADTACYAAKDRGRGRCHLYLADDPHIIAAERTLNWANTIQRAFDDNRFEVYLQGIVGRDQKLLGYEALIRMHHETGEVVSPGTFMPAIQRMGWMTRIDQWMLQHVIALACQWPSVDGYQPYISLNLCARSISDASFVDNMLSMIDASGVDGGTLRFEITETDELQTGANEMRLIDQLRQRGFRVWLDDVGTGYNSFELLKRLHVDGIKIDRSFTHALVADPVDRALTEALISIGKLMRLEIVAEGVEDEATYQALLDMKADAFQGHHFYRAESAPDVLLHQVSDAA